MIVPLLPSKYSPLWSNGDGNQSYLHEISNALPEVLMGLSGNQRTFAFSDGFEAAQNALEIEWAASIITDDTERETKATSIVPPRKGYLNPELC